MLISIGKFVVKFVFYILGILLILYFVSHVSVGSPGAAGFVGVVIYSFFHVFLWGYDTVETEESWFKRWSKERTEQNRRNNEWC